MTTHLIIGAGAVGSAVAEQSAESGASVVVATRSGRSRGADLPVIALDANDPVKLNQTLVQHNPDAVFACMHGSSYSAAVWARELPPLEKTILDAAARADIPVIFPESLYAFGEPLGRPFTETSELRATSGKPAVRVDLLEQRHRSAATTISVAASDYFGPYDNTSHIAQLIVGKVIAGKRPQALGSPDAPHSFTYVPDLAAAMLAAADRARELAPEGDRILFAPTSPASSMAIMADGFAQVAGLGPTAPRAIPAGLVKALAPVVPGFKELRDVLYQWTQPYVMDSTESERILGLSPTDIDTAIKATIGEARNRGVGH